MGEGRAHPWMTSSQGPLWAFVGSVPCSRSLGDALEVFWHFPPPPDPLPCSVCTGFATGMQCNGDDSMPLFSFIIWGGNGGIAAVMSHRGDSYQGGRIKVLLIKSTNVCLEWKGQRQITKCLVIYLLLQFSPPLFCPLCKASKLCTVFVPFIYAWVAV